MRSGAGTPGEVPAARLPSCTLCFPRGPAEGRSPQGSSTTPCLLQPRSRLSIGEQRASCSCPPCVLLAEQQGRGHPGRLAGLSPTLPTEDRRRLLPHPDTRLKPAGSRATHFPPCCHFFSEEIGGNYSVFLQAQGRPSGSCLSELENPITRLSHRHPPVLRR